MTHNDEDNDVNIFNEDHGYDSFDKIRGGDDILCIWNFMSNESELNNLSLLPETKTDVCFGLVESIV